MTMIVKGQIAYTLYVLRMLYASCNVAAFCFDMYVVGKYYDKPFTDHSVSQMFFFFHYPFAERELS